MYNMVPFLLSLLLFKYSYLKSLYKRTIVSMFATFPENVLIVLGLLILIWWETSTRVWGEGRGTFFLPMSPSFHRDSGSGWNMPAENWVRVQTDSPTSEPRRTTERVGLCGHIMCSWAAPYTGDLRLAPYAPPRGYMACGRSKLWSVLPQTGVESTSVAWKPQSMCSRSMLAQHPLRQWSAHQSKSNCLFQ